MSDDDESALRIETDELTLEFSGDADRVEAAYGAVHRILAAEFEATMQASANGSTDDQSLGDDQTQPLYKSDRAPSQPDQPSPPARPSSTHAPQATDNAIKLVLHRENYTRIHILERRELADSFLAETLEASRIRRLHVGRTTLERLRETLTIGETLWRELTTAGRREVARRSRGDWEETNE